QFILSSRYFPSMHMTLSSVCSLSLHDALPISGAGSGGAPLVSRVLGRCQQPGEPDRNSECEDAMGRLDDRVALITGAARGQGAAAARRFVDEGASVVVADVLSDDGKALADELGSAAVFHTLDVSDEDSWSAAMQRVSTEFGR